MIELKRNPLGAPVRQSRGIVPMRVKNDATSLTDKLRIANKVNNKYSESLTEKLKLLEELETEVGQENVDELLNPSKNGVQSSGKQLYIIFIYIVCFNMGILYTTYVYMYNVYRI